MSLSDCIKCWDTPCRCGYAYRDWPVDQLETFISVLRRVAANRSKQSCTNMEMGNMLSRIQEAIEEGQDHVQICDAIAEHFSLTEGHKGYHFPQWLSRIVEGEMNDYKNGEGHWGETPKVIETNVKIDRSKTCND